MYSKKKQVTMIDATLKNKTANDAEKIDRYNSLSGKPIIDKSSRGTNYFSKGHLSPDAAFIYQLEQYAAYYFINVAPQFQAFNAGNWKALEFATRKVADRYVSMILCKMIWAILVKIHLTILKY